MMDADGVTLYGNFEEVDGVYYSNLNWQWIYNYTTRKWTSWRDNASQYYADYYETDADNYETDADASDDGATCGVCSDCGRRSDDIKSVNIDGVVWRLCGDCRDFIGLSDNDIWLDEKTP